MLYTICCLRSLKQPSCLLHLSEIPDCSFYKMAKNPLCFVVFCFWFRIHKSNQNHTKHFSFLLKYLDSSCQSTHGAPILNLILQSCLTFVFFISACVIDEACFWNLTSNDWKMKHYYLYCWYSLIGMVDQLKQWIHRLMVEQLCFWLPPHLILYLHAKVNVLRAISNVLLYLRLKFDIQCHPAEVG